MNNLYKLLYKKITTGGFTDYELSLIISIYIKNNNIYLLSCNIEDIIKLIIDYPLSCILIYNYYKLCIRKINVLVKIKEWQMFYKNNIFWNILSYEQTIKYIFYGISTPPVLLCINYLLSLKHRFNSIFDCAKGGKKFYYKLYYLFENKLYHETIKNEITERLIMLLNLIDRSTFISLNIPLIRIKEFNDLSYESILKYIIIIYKKIRKLLNSLIELFHLYNISCVKLNNIINIISHNNLLHMNTVYYLN
jgi:hypothetical protein